MKISIRFEDIQEAFQRVLTRFPLETLISLLLTGIIIYSIEIWHEVMWISHAITSLIITFLLSVGTTLFRESRNSMRYDVLFPIIPIIYGIAYYVMSSGFGNGNSEQFEFFFLHLAGFVAILFVAPYLKKLFSADINTVEYSNYFTSIAWTKLMAAIVGVSVLLLGFVAIGSVVELFDLSSIFKTERLFGYWAAISLVLIAPLYGLIHFPELSSMERNTYETNRFFSFLVRFVGIPFIFLYFAILYAYSGRVLLNFHDWPKGIVSWLVIGFSTFGYLIYIFSKPYEQEKGAIMQFRKYFPFAVLPQILMLFYAIYLRIAQYDLTIDRYFVVVFGAWLTVISLYFAFSRKKLLLAIPALLTFFSLAISFGPWGVFSLPLERQYDRFIHNIEQAGILQSGKIIPLTKPVETKLNNEIISEVEYICNHHSCEKLRPLFQKVLDDAEKSSNSSSSSSLRRSGHLTSWEWSQAITRAMNISYQSVNDYAANEKYINLSLAYDKKEPYYPLDIAGYQNILKIYAQNTTNVTRENRYLEFNPDTDSLTLYDAGKTESLSLSAVTEKLKEKYLDRMSEIKDPTELVFTLTSTHYEIKVMLDGYVYKNPSYDGKNMNGWYNVSGIALLKNKQP